MELKPQSKPTTKPDDKKEEIILHNVHVVTDQNGRRLELRVPFDNPIATPEYWAIGVLILQDQQGNQAQHQFFYQINAASAQQAFDEMEKGHKEACDKEYRRLVDERNRIVAPR